jgi:hypothetical protein
MDWLDGGEDLLTAQREQDELPRARARVAAE